MAYIGYNPSQLAIAPFATKYFTGNGVTTTFTLDQSVPGANEANVEVFVENVQQNPVDAYTIGGALNNQLIFSEAPVTGGAIYVIHKGEATYNLQPATGSVTANTLDPVLRNFTVDKFTGTGAQTAFTLTDTPYSPNSILVSIDGIVQQAGTNYTLSGTTLTFAAEAPDLGSDITVIHMGFSSGNKAVMDASITPVKLSTGGPSWDTTGNFRVPLGGVITAGDVSSTNGSVIIQGFYSNSGALSVIGSERSTGGLFLGYGVRPGTTQGTPLSSTAIPIARSSIVMDSNVIKFNRAASQTVAIGSPVTMTESMRINENGKVGIAATPSNWKATWPALDIGQAASFYSQDNNTTGIGSNLYFTGSVWGRKTLGAAALYQLSEGGHYWYSNPSGAADSTFSPTTIMQIENSGILTLPFGQIKFPVVQNASSDPNTLDDYEEGSWTPTVVGTSTNPSSVNYSTQYGRYTKIGNVVYLSFRVSFSFTGGSGSIWLTGLPYTAANNIQPKGALQQDYVTFTGFTYLEVGANQGLTSIGFGKNRSGNTAAGLQLSDCAAGGTDLNGGIYYFV